MTAIHERVFDKLNKHKVLIIIYVLLIAFEFL
jgi:hypothetical protein